LNGNSGVVDEAGRHGEDLVPGIVQEGDDKAIATLQVPRARQGWPPPIAQRAQDVSNQASSSDPVWEGELKRKSLVVQQFGCGTPIAAIPMKGRP